jgi:hypothetical protein
MDQITAKQPGKSQVDRVRKMAGEDFDFHYNRALLALIDVLGYQRLVEQSTHKEIYRLIKGALEPRQRVGDDVGHPAHHLASNIKVQVVSDTILMITDMVVSDADANMSVLLEHLCKFCLRLTSTYGLLLREGISIGDYYHKTLFRKRTSSSSAKPM